MLPTPQISRPLRRNRLSSAPARIENTEDEKNLQKSTEVMKHALYKRSEICLHSYEDEFFKDFEARGIRTPIESEKYKCKICEKKFFHLNALKAHQMVHSTTEVFTPTLKCTDCNKKFSSKLKLTLHNDQHHSQGTKVLAVL